MNKKLLPIFIFPLIIFWPSITTFFTNDDFFFLKISRISNFWQFLNFFNFIKGPDGLGVYRPLTTQVFYMITNPVVMHLLVFITFFGILYLIYKLGLLLFNDEKIALISTLLYSVSATHFAHFYYLATYQELGMTLFVLLSILTHLNKKYYLSILFFVLGLMSKETAIVVPFLLLLVDWYTNSKIIFKKYISYFVILCIYLLTHIFLYGLATGDSYVWDFSLRKLLNTTFWYLLWSLNLPETLVDFIGPKFYVNPNLFKYWASTIYPILGLFVIQLIFIAGLMVRFLNKIDNKKNSLFAMAWFLFSLTPVMFLPIHKFSFYLTLPLIGIVFRIGYLFIQNRTSNILICVFSVVWLSCSLLTVHHSRLTSWITNGSEISARVYKFFQNNKFSENKISLVDTSKDLDLPWSPTEVVKNALSNKNFFIVYFPELADKIEYNEKTGKQIESRQFLGY